MAEFNCIGHGSAGLGLRPLLQHIQRFAVTGNRGFLDDHLGNIGTTRQVVHGVEQGRFDDRTQTTSTRLAFQSTLGNGLECLRAERISLLWSIFRTVSHVSSGVFPHLNKLPAVP